MKLLLILINLAVAQTPQFYYTNSQYEDENANVTMDDIKKIKSKVQDDHDVLEAGELDLETDTSGYTEPEY